MIRRSFFSGLCVFVCLLLNSTVSYGQLTNGGAGGGGNNANTGGLIGGNANGGSATGGLIGADAATNQAVQQGLRATGNFQNGLTGNTGGGGGNRTTRQFGAGGGAGGGGARGGGQTAAPRRVIRPVLRIAFDYPVPGKRVESSLNRQLDRVSIRLNNRFRTLGIQVGEKGLVTLVGEVQSENDKKLAAAYVRLEPGVRKVENKVVVVAPKR